MDIKSAIRDYISLADKACFGPTDGRWYYWDGDCWSEDIGQVRIRTGVIDVSRGSVTPQFVRDAIWSMESDFAFCVWPEKMDTHPTMMACEGVTVDLRSAEGLKPAAIYKLFKKSGLPPKSISTPTWDAFFSWLNNHDEARIEAMYRLLGYFLTGSTKEHKVFFLYGPGRNGKSVLLELVKHIMGSHAASVSPLLLVKDQHANRHPTELMTLRGARLGIMAELPPGSKMDTSRMKALTGGDTICARGMRQDEVNFTNTCKLIAAVNDLPEIECAGHAEKSRIIIIPCANIVPEEDIDRDLLDKLKVEAPGILAKIIGGSKRYLEGGIQWTQDVIDATAEMWEDGDDLADFIGQECLEGLDLRAPKGEFYQRYSAFRYNAGLDKVSSKAVASSMKKIGHKDGRVSGQKYWKNLALKSLDAGEKEW